MEQMPKTRNSESEGKKNGTWKGAVFKFHRLERLYSYLNIGGLSMHIEHGHAATSQHQFVTGNTFIRDYKHLAKSYVRATCRLDF
jgi:hypothetical protein